MPNNSYNNASETGNCSILLNRSRQGCVSACGCHPVVHIVFANWQMDVPYAAFADLVTMIAETDVSDMGCEHSGFMTSRPFALPIHNTPLALRFSETEWDEFRALLAGTRARLHLLSVGPLATMRN